MSPPGRPKGEYRSAKHEGTPVSPQDHAQGESGSAQPGSTPSRAPLVADAAPLLLWAPQAWLADGWRERVLMQVGADAQPAVPLLPLPLRAKVLPAAA